MQELRKPTLRDKCQMMHDRRLLDRSIPVRFERVEREFQESQRLIEKLKSAE